jgi:uncharacterized protein (TIGR03067 family)
MQGHNILVASIVVALGLFRWPNVQQTEEEKLHGTWVLIEVKFGKISKAVKDGQVTFSFARGGKVMKKGGVYRDSQYDFSINPKAMPKQIDFINREEKDKDRRIEKHIYRIEGDTLTLAWYTDSFRKRPPSFDSEEIAIFILKRK